MLNRRDIRELVQRSAWECISEDELVDRFVDLVTFLAGDKSEGDSLFALERESGKSSLSFGPYFAYAVSLCQNYRGRELFMPGAFRGWMDAFDQNLSVLWSPAVSPLLEERPGIGNEDFFEELARRYPILACQLVCFVHDYAEHIRLLMEDVSACLAKACDTLLAGEPVSRVQRVAPPGSDRHQHARTVHVLTLESGSRLVYKPHAMDIDRAFGSWLEWISDAAGYQGFCMPRSIDAPHGGLCTYLVAKPLARRQDAALFFRREGFLMGSLYLLKGSDMHLENILACADRPAVIDLETVFTPDDSLLGRLGRRRLPFHVSDSCFLPLTRVTPGFRRFEIDALTASNPVLDARNLPWFGDESFRGTAFVDEICAGFSDALHTAMLHRDEAKATLRQSFAGCRVRLVLKATLSYATVLRALGMPERVASPKAYEEMLARTQVFGAWVSETDRRYVSRVEREALRRLDIPYFSEELGHAQICGMQAWLEEQDEERLDDSLRAIRWALAFHTVDEGATVPLGHLRAQDQGAARVRADALVTMAERLTRPLLRLARPIIAAKPEIVKDVSRQCYYLSSNAGACKCLLDGSLGLLVALSAYCSLNPRRTDIQELVSHVLEEEFADEKRLAPGLVALEPGIADGTAGLLLGARLCLQMGTLSKPAFRFVVDKIAGLSSQARKIRIAPSNELYGCAGLVAAIESLPQDLRTARLEELRGLLYDNLSRDSRLKSVPRADVYRLVQDELSGRAGMQVDRPSRNHSLRFGNAGKLYNYTNSVLAEAQVMRRTETSEQLASVLAAAQGALPGIEYPDDCVEVGLLHGLSGVLFCLCRYEAPDKVPPIL